MTSTADTIAAIATPSGEAGLGVIRVSGARAVDVVSGLFYSPKQKDLQSVPSHTCHYGTFGAAPSLDHVVVTVFRAPRSYTGEDVVEISAHGSPYGLHQILQACLRQGARLAAPGEFTLRAFLSGKLDLTQAEAVADLIRARTDKTQTAALAQLEGSLARAVRNLRSRLLPLLAHVEVGLDHADEDHDFLNRDRLLAQCREVEEEIDRLLVSARVGKILRDGFRVTLIGRPNVGKSSLLNAFLKEDRAIVTPIAGTTRDTLEEKLSWDGVPVVLTDTAGLRSSTDDPVEKVGIARTRQALEAADILIGLFDGSEPLTPEDYAVIAACAGKPHVWVVNKTDLSSQWDSALLSSLNGGGPVLKVSATSGQGLDALTQTIKSLALGQNALSADALWLLNARHEQALERSRDALRRATNAASENSFEECVAMELQGALSALGDIIGETASEDLLGEIFSRFCIGK